MKAKTLFNQVTDEPVALYPSNTKGSDRLVGSINVDGEEVMVMTTADCDPNTPEDELYAYLTEAGWSPKGSNKVFDQRIIWLSDKEPKEAARLLRF